MILYHSTTPAKAKTYRQTGRIISPVRGFTTLQAAMAWGCKVGRKVVLSFETTNPYKLPDHHNRFGDAWWNDGDIYQWKCEFSADKDS